MMTPDSNEDIPGFFEIEEDLYEPAGPQDQSTDSNADDYKDMLIELHSFAKRQAGYYKNKSKYK
ncbi:hypothetical protein [Candidatus Neptunichlamydia sp. REUL1]|uniref:hypothetical protein n=1 Tax=Candidatus Neptunichlamydia sp. REUL1 TaxID=3064277 RepID=UPI002930AA5F|nr:hypothetical protein [Candidatus Neptunochlamydia sp. REUL1]